MEVSDQPSITEVEWAFLLHDRRFNEACYAQKTCMPNHLPPISFLFFSHHFQNCLKLFGSQLSKYIFYSGAKKKKNSMLWMHLWTMSLLMAWCLVPLKKVFICPFWFVVWTKRSKKFQSIRKWKVYTWLHKVWKVSVQIVTCNFSVIIWTFISRKGWPGILAYDS